MSNSVLVRIKLDENGFLSTDQDAWKVGECDGESGDGISGMHNLSLSPSHPGCVWVSLQYANQLLLVDAATLHVLKVIQVPTTCVLPDGSACRVGGPHCMRECAATGEIWVALKGAVACQPGTAP